MPRVLSFALSHDGEQTPKTLCSSCSACYLYIYIFFFCFPLLCHLSLPTSLRENGCACSLVANSWATTVGRASHVFLATRARHLQRASGDTRIFEQRARETPATCKYCAMMARWIIFVCFFFFFFFFLSLYRFTDLQSRARHTCVSSVPLLRGFFENNDIYIYTHHVHVGLRLSIRNNIRTFKQKKHVSFGSRGTRDTRLHASLVGWETYRVVRSARVQRIHGTDDACIILPSRVCSHVSRASNLFHAYQHVCVYT